VVPGEPENNAGGVTDKLWHSIHMQVIWNTIRISLEDDIALAHLIDLAMQLKASVAFWTMKTFLGEQLILPAM
jgi:hypothetical protein